MAAILTSNIKNLISERKIIYLINLKKLLTFKIKQVEFSKLRLSLSGNVVYVLILDYMPYSSFPLGLKNKITIFFKFN